MQVAVEVLFWLIAFAWWSKVLPSIFKLKLVPDLATIPAQTTPANNASVTVIVPAKNEAASIETTLRSLMQQDYAPIDVIAVNDRSDDATGSIMDRVAAEFPSKLRVIHIKQLPEGWTGKVHAMSLAASQAKHDWLLFTDGDVKFRKDSVRLTVAVAEEKKADHFVLIPTMEIHSIGEGMVMGFFQTVSVWVSRPWRVPDPAAKRDIVGIGAFNMIRRTSYQQIGGYEARPMEILEDMQLARAAKLGGLHSEVAFGRNLISIHWAVGVRGLVNAMTKNIFSGFGFHVWLLLIAALWELTFAFFPWLALGVPYLRLPALATIAAMFAAYAIYRKQSGIQLTYLLLAPFAVLVFVYIMVKSMLVALKDGGVTWRGTFYPLAELRKRAVPMW